MSAAASRVVGAWGDRSYLLPKDMVYVLSLNLRAQINGQYLQVLSAEDGLDHIFGDTVVTMPEGVRCDLPVGKVAGGQGQIGTAEDPTSVALELRLRLLLNGTEMLHVECAGVANFYGGLQAFRSVTPELLAGNAFIATRHETDSATFRWFNRRQLFGIGRMEGIKGSEPRELQLSFDLYASA